MTQSGDHMQRLNAVNEGQIIGGSMGVFYGGADRSIGQNSSFLDSTVPTQSFNDVTIIVATSALQYAASIYAASVKRAEKTSLYCLGAIVYA